MHIFGRSLNTKVAVLVSTVVLVTLLGLFLSISYWQKQNLVSEIHSSSERALNFLQMAIQDPMVIGDDAGTRTKFKEVGSKYNDISVSLTDFNGQVTYSTEPELLDQDLLKNIKHERVSSLLVDSLKGAPARGEIIDFNEKPHYLEVHKIENGPDCYHCHGSSREVLGSMVMLLDSSSSFAKLSSVQLKMGIISLAGIILLVALLVFFLKRTVISKVHSMERISDRISSGDLDLTFESEGDDELAKLGQNLTRMVQTIKDQLEYNKSVLSGLKLPMFITDTKDKVTYANQELLNLFNRNESEVVGRMVGESFSSNLEGTSLSSQVLSQQSYLEKKVVFSRNGQGELPVRFAGSPLMNAQGETVGTLGIMIDLSREEEDKAVIQKHQENMVSVANQVSEVALQLSSAAEELSQQMNEIAQGLSVSTDQTDQVATAMEQMNATVLEVAQNASSTASSAEEANEVARAGGEEVERTVDEITHVSRTTVSLSDTLNDLAGKVENIGQVMSVINDIADQTNLLALNAAIEAARAGDAGRGFAVVADEVRKLAEKTMQATKEVEKAITEIQTGTQEAVEEMTTTKSRVDNTTSMARKAGEVLSEVMQKASKISDMVRNIATAAEEQSATSEQINSNVNQMNVLTKESSQGVQQANMAIKEVAEMAQSLRALVDQLNK
ncbi:MAG: methyl-accepting chemotaxis protein [Desulfovibrionales bacterium]